jgi:hypothetical protein
MRIYIPTLERSEQITLGNLPESVQKDVVIVTDKKSTKALHLPTVKDITKLNIVVCPERGIGKVRQWIIDNHDMKKHGKQLLMLDDDLSFAVRRMDDPTRFLPADDNDVLQMLTAVENAASTYAHGGILSREGGNRILEPLKYNGRNLRALFYDVTVMRKEKIRFDVLPVMEDFSTALALLCAGYPSIAVCGWVQDQGMSNAPGGCSTYRSLSVQREGALGLQRLYPKFVKVVEKTTKTAWGGQTRTDVRIQWGKAYASSKK